MTRAPTRIVVTGVGMVCPVGVGRAAWEALLAGRSGIAPVVSFDTSRYRVHRGAEVRDLDPARGVRRLDPAALGRASQLGICAAWIAIEDAGLDPSAVETHRAGVAMGTTSGEPQLVESFNDRRLAGRSEGGEEGFVDRYPCHVISGHLASEVGWSGPNAMIPTACAAGNYAVAWAADQLRAGRAEIMLAGGADCFSRITWTGFARLGAIAPECCQPFDKGRKGMIPGEGAGVLVLERADSALERGARIYAEVAGYGISCDAFHMTAAHSEGAGAARAMEGALRMAGLRPQDVSYISAHGTGTPTNDRLESLAVHRVFGSGTSVPISSIKSMIGHTMGAASAIEAAACALAIDQGVVPPTINFETPDPDCSLDCVPNHARELDVEVAMSNAYAFGGNNASLILRRFAA